MNDIIGIKFLLKYGAWFASAIRVKDANEIIHKWTNSEYPPEKAIGGHSPLPGDEGNVWSILAGDIIGIHTFRLEQAQPPAVQRIPPPGKYPPYLASN